uniref:Uncharacterized protein n=1 Tax=Knipowitschia caucasica TaxID=637954 RepID=A0AAV2JAA3_KNICA
MALVCTFGGGGGGGGAPSRRPRLSLAEGGHREGTLQKTQTGGGGGGGGFPQGPHSRPKAWVQCSPPVCGGGAEGPVMRGIMAHELRPGSRCLSWDSPRPLKHSSPTEAAPNLHMNPPPGPRLWGGQD